MKRCQGTIKRHRRPRRQCPGNFRVMESCNKGYPYIVKPARKGCPAGGNGRPRRGGDSSGARVPSIGTALLAEGKSRLMGYRIYGVSKLEVRTRDSTLERPTPTARKERCPHISNSVRAITMNVQRGRECLAPGPLQGDGAVGDASLLP